MKLRGGVAASIAVVASLALAPSAGAIADPQQAIGGAGSKWFTGSLIQQIGENCSVLGSPYTEVMVGGSGSYGGAPGQGVVKVNDPYWVSLLVSIPGNPCGSGSSSVVTDLVMPRNTSYDASRSIRCFGTNRFSDDFFEVTNQTWNFLGHSGRYCPTGPSGAPLGQRFGFRPLANGQMFWIFVPVKTTTTLQGADEFNWLTQSTGTYSNPGRSYIWANVFPASGGGTPSVYFATEPAVIPFWKDDAPAGTQNRVEFLANLYSAGFAGNLCFEIRRTDTNAFVGDCVNPPSGWNGTVPLGGSLFQVFGTGEAEGPNGGFVPFAYNQAEWDKPMRITWDFTYNDGGVKHATGSKTFRTLSGPDLDGDGVPDSVDQCDDVAGTLANGCLPGIPKLNGGVALKRGAKLPRKGLATGRNLGLSCNLSSRASAVLTVKRKAAKRFGLAALVIGRGASARCTSADGGKLKLKLTKPAAKKLRGKKADATLSVTFTRQGSQPRKIALPVKVV